MGSLLIKISIIDLFFSIKEEFIDERLFYKRVIYYLNS